MIGDQPTNRDLSPAVPMLRQRPPLPMVVVVVVVAVAVQPPNDRMAMLLTVPCWEMLTMMMAIRLVAMTVRQY
jgi:hypothetical protein